MERSSSTTVLEPVTMRLGKVSQLQHTGVLSKMAVGLALVVCLPLLLLGFEVLLQRLSVMARINVA